MTLLFRAQGRTFASSRHSGWNEESQRGAVILSEAKNPGILSNHALPELFFVPQGGTRSNDIRPVVFNNLVKDRRQK